MLRIITTHKLRFYNKDRSENFVSSGKNIIEDAPDWIMQDDMYTFARSCGRLQIISSRKDQRVMEEEPDKHLAQNSHEEKEFMGVNSGEVSEEVEEEVEELDDEAIEEAVVETEEAIEALKAAKKAARKAKRKAKKAEESEEE